MSFVFVLSVVSFLVEQVCFLTYSIISVNADMFPLIYLYLTWSEPLHKHMCKRKKNSALFLLLTIAGKHR